LRVQPPDDETPQPATQVEHLVTWQEASGTTVILGLDDACQPVLLTAFDPAS
jgi:hypothetical protein